MSLAWRPHCHSLLRLFPPISNLAIKNLNHFYFLDVFFSAVNNLTWQGQIPLWTADERWGFIFTSRNCFVFMFQIPCIFHQGSPEHSSSPLTWENSHTWDIWSVLWSNGLSWGRQGSSLLGTYDLLFLSWEVLPARITSTVLSFSPPVSRVN